MMKISSFIFGIMFLITSCDTYISINGKVISSINGKPINGAKVELLNVKLNTNTDENGKFSFEKHTGKVNLPHIIRVSIENYKPFVLKMNSESDYIVYKIRQDSEYFDFDEPFYPNPDNKETFILSTSIENYSQDFKIKSDSIIIYLDDKNLKKEIEEFKNNWKE